MHMVCHQYIRVDFQHGFDCEFPDKLARLVCNMLKNGSEYVDEGREQYEQKYKSRVLKKRVLKNLKQKDKDMGIALMSIEPAVQTS